MLSEIDTWLEVAPADGFDLEAIDFVKDFMSMLKARIDNLHVQNQTNGEIYRHLHVEKNII